MLIGLLWGSGNCPCGLQIRHLILDEGIRLCVDISAPAPDREKSFRPSIEGMRHLAGVMDHVASPPHPDIIASNPKGLPRMSDVSTCWTDLSI